MARLLMKALDSAGFAPQLASGVRTFDKAGDRQVQEDLKRQSLEEASRLVARYKDRPEELRPALWFTYHVYYKAPDWIGPRVSRALNIPYVIAEGSRAPKRAHGPWALAHEAAESALDQANAIFVMTAKDRVALEQARRPHQALIELPPFLDPSEWPMPSPARSEGEPRLLTVAMMREGDKLASYRILAASLASLRRPWTLDIVGDGEARGEVSRLFAPFGGRVRLHGQAESRAVLRGLYEAADLFVWPAVNEAYGMALLEAQLFGCPVVAGRYGGVASVVEDGATGLLTPPGDIDAFTEAVATLLAEDDRRRSCGAAARRLILQERGLDQAAARLHTALHALVGDSGA
jgi:glycosyltransferase involved in cell wall biosynthesis